MVDSYVELATGPQRNMAELLRDHSELQQLRGYNRLSSIGEHKRQTADKILNASAFDYEAIMMKTEGPDRTTYGAKLEKLADFSQVDTTSPGADERMNYAARVAVSVNIGDKQVALFAKTIELVPNPIRGSFHEVGTQSVPTEELPSETVPVIDVEGGTDALVLFLLQLASPARQCQDLLRKAVVEFLLAGIRAVLGRRAAGDDPLGTVSLSVIKPSSRSRMNSLLCLGQRTRYPRVADSLTSIVKTLTFRQPTDPTVISTV